MMHQVEVREWDHEYGDQGDNDDGGQHDPSTSGELGRASGELVDRERRTERRGACELSQLFLNPLHGNPSRPPSAMGGRPSRPRVAALASASVEATVDRDMCSILATSP